MTARLARRTNLKRAAKAAAACAALAALAVSLGALFPFPATRAVEAEAGGSALILDRGGGVIAWRVDAAESWRLPVAIDEVSPWLLKATVAAEDRRFWSHPGVDPLAVARAVRQNASNRRRVSGASTITMQTIRLIWPRERTYPAKCVEAFRALQLEGLAQKRGVLQLYLNLAPYGGNIVGVEAASRRYFAKRATELTLGEAALLAGIPQRPARFDPRKHLDSALRRREYVLRRMRELELASKAEIRTARRERIEISRAPGRTPAPRFADYVLARRGGGGGIIRTTLEPGTQAAALDAARRHAEKLRPMGIDGVAIVVVDVPNAALAAMIGSADPSAPATGQVNCATARRQPGSLLKPFIYAAAFDAGELTPRELVYDVPTSWRGYRPRNIDRRFLGPVCAARALRESRNVPAVRLLERLGAARVARDFSRLGLGIAAAEDRCGLSLALGTPEVRLVDIANAYAALARLGGYRPLRVLDGESGGPLTRVYSPGASYLVLRSLGAPRPGGEARPAWKTGTSWDHRDAWAVALSPRHVIAVWCGRLSGRGHPVLAGARTALPVALELAGHLRGKSPASWSRPRSVRTRRVCALSGAPVAAACPHTVEAEYLPGVSREAPCVLHRVERSGGERRLVTVWPAEAARYFASRASEARDAAVASVEIVSPVDGGEYLLPPPGAAGTRLLDFCARSSRPGADVFWFLDGEMLARAPSDASVRWPMTPGPHELIASDARGSSARVRFSVSPIEG